MRSTWGSLDATTDMVCPADNAKQPGKDPVIVSPVLLANDRDRVSRMC